MSGIRIAATVVSTHIEEGGGRSERMMGLEKPAEMIWQPIRCHLF